MATSNLARKNLGQLCPIGVPIVGFAACGAIVRGEEAFLKAGGFEQRFGVGGEEQILARNPVQVDIQVKIVEKTL